ncbi:MAG: PQQ-like beta-propeller repeat protein [Pirellulales bacterium]|nr:PQQ-like beta-propeller repeat protein [Pirellulales bacterium]
MIRFVLFLSTLAAPLCDMQVLADEPLQSTAMDWPNWRGPQQNRVSNETNLVEHWDPQGGPNSNLLWKNDELGGRSTPIVMGSRLFTLVRDQGGTTSEGAKVVCVDAATGNMIWQHRFNVYLTDVPDTRVGWSSVAGDPETGRVYALSVSGYFCCLEGATGKLVWKRSLHEEFGLLSTYGGRTHSPIVFEDTVIVSAVVIGWGDAPQWGFLAKPAHRFMSFDKATGKLRWLKGTGISPYDTTYSTPTIPTLNGQAAMIFGSGDGELWALQPRTGERIWHFPFSRRGLFVSPLVVGDTVYASHSEENVIGNTMGSVVALDGTLSGDLSGQEKWQEFEVMAGKSSPIMVDGKLWVVEDRAKLWIFEPETGEILLRRKAFGKDKVMRSTPLYADGKVYLSTGNGRWHVLKPTDTGFKVLDRFRLHNEACDGSPIVSHGRIYLPTSAALYCIGRNEERSTASQAPMPQPTVSQLTETAPADDPAVAHIQIVPYDTLLAPDQQVDFKVHQYNARGQRLRILSGDDVKLAVSGPGSVENGTYTAPTLTAHQASLVTCKIGDLTGSARLRIVPPLPWNFDFNHSEKVPLTWVGGRVRYVVRDIAGEKVAVKRSVLPTPRDPNNKLGTRSRMWMGPTDLADYTIQADFALQISSASQGSGATQSGKMPDLGLINSRYTMTVRSSNKQLRIYSWSAHEYRTFAAVPFDPVPGKWYTMKLKVTPAGKTASVQGKLWDRGNPEPEDWTIQMVDPSPNHGGSPGLYGNAQEAEIYVDNIRIIPNQSI